MLIGDTVKQCVGDPDIRITRRTTDGDAVTICFSLTDPEDGTVVHGHRTFARHTSFHDIADFKRELWAGSLTEKQPVAPLLWRKAFSLAVLIAAIPAAWALSEWIAEAPASLGFILAVGTTAALLGTRAGFAMSGLAAIGYNLFGIHPQLTPTAPGPQELILLAFFILLSLYVPWLKRRFI